MSHTTNMRGSFALTTAPSVEPVSLAEAKLHRRVDGGAEDDLLSRMIKSARRYVENETGRALITQTWQYALDDFPAGHWIEIPKPPLQSVGSTTYHDEDLTTSTVFAASKYQVDTIPTPPVVVLKRGESWPSDTLRRSSGVVIEFDAGYGDDASDVPADLKDAILLLVGALYENREPEVTGTVVARLGFSFDALVSDYRLYGF